MITLDDKYKFKDFGLYVEEGHDHPVTPSFVRKVMHIPGRPGQWDFGTEIREKAFQIPLATQSRDRVELQRRLNNFVAFLFDEFGQPREFKLVYDYEPGKFYKVKVAESFSPERVRPFSRFILPLVANDPYKYSNVYADEVTWGSEEITFEYDYLLGHTNDFADNTINITNPRTVNITVSGLAVQPIIYIEGSANNLTLSANGHSFSLPNFTFEKWEIDFNRYVVFRNGQETMEEIWDFYLMPGNNQIQVTGNNIDIELSVKFRDKYN